MKGATLLFIFAAVLGLEAWEAVRAPLYPMDEALWFRKAQATSAHVMNPDDRFYAVDVPGFNRWIYWPMFRITGLYRVPPGEPECWSVRGGRIYFKGTFNNPAWPRNPTEEQFQWFVHRHGRYAPRSSMMALRFTNIAVYGVMLAALWWTARAALKSPWLALLAVSPVALTPAFNLNLAFVTWSGDIFMLAAVAVTLAAWTRFHLAGAATSRKAIIVTGILCGIAAGSKLNGILVLAAYCLYLAIVSRSFSRLANPAMAAAIAFAVFLAVDPVVFLYPDRAPWQVLTMMVVRRGQVVADWTRREGPLAWAEFYSHALFWWPMLPAAVWAFWKCRRRAWFLPLALWCGVMVVGTLVGVLEVNRADDEYLGPVYMALYFPVAVAFISLGIGQAGEAGARGITENARPAGGG